MRTVSRAISIYPGTFSIHSQLAPVWDIMSTRVWRAFRLVLSSFPPAFAEEKPWHGGPAMQIEMVGSGIRDSSKACVKLLMASG